MPDSSAASTSAQEPRLEATWREQRRQAGVEMLFAATEAMARLVPSLGAVCRRVAGGCVAFNGPTSVISLAVGVGSTAPVSEAEVDAIEVFYREQKCAAKFGVSRESHPSLASILARRGYRPYLRLRNWWRPISVEDLSGTGGVSVGGIAVGEADGSQSELWARTVVAGFVETDGPVELGSLAPTSIHEFSSLGFARDCKAFLAWRGGEPAGGGVLYIYQQIAILRTTSCRWAHRRHGVQSALIRARLAAAARSGCSAVFADTGEEDDSSARNLGRFGFRPYSDTQLWARADKALS